MIPTDECLDIEAQSAFIEGTLSAEATAVVVRHLSRCARCRLAVERAAEVSQDIDAERQSVRYAAIAAAIVVLVLAGTLFLSESKRWQRPDALERMIASAPVGERQFEARLSGGFKWAPYRNQMVSEPEKSAEELTAAGVAGEVLADLKNDASARAIHDKGIARLIRGDAEAAMWLLRQSAKLAPDNARTWNDLAAARYVHAQTAEELREALEDARRALARDPRMSEARFNVALIQERIGTKEEAAAAWREYLRHDSSSRWAQEARDRLARYTP